MDNRTSVGMYIAFFSLGLIGNILGPTLPAIRAEFDIGLKWAGTLFSLQFAGSLVATLAAGYLSDIVGRKPLLVAGAAALSGGVLIFAAATTQAAWLLPAGAMLFGAGFGALDAAANAHINERFGTGSGPVMNRVHAFFGVGSLTGPLIAGAVIGAGYSWRIAYLAAAAFPIIYLALISGETLAHAPEKWGMAPRDTGGPKQPSGDLAALVNRRFVLLALALFIYVGVEVGVSGWGVTFLEKEFNQDVGAASVTVSLFWLAVTLGRFIHQRLAKRARYSVLMAAGGFGAAGALIIVVFGTSGFVASLGFILTGLFLSGIFPTGLGLAGRLFPANFGAVSGSLIAAGNLGGALLPPVVGFMGGTVGLRVGMGFLLAASLLIGVISLLMVAWEPDDKKRLPKAS